MHLGVSGGLQCSHWNALQFFDHCFVGRESPRKSDEEKIKTTVKKAVFCETLG